MGGIEERVECVDGEAGVIAHVDRAGRPDGRVARAVQLTSSSAGVADCASRDAEGALECPEGSRGDAEDGHVLLGRVGQVHHVVCGVEGEAAGVGADLVLGREPGPVLNQLSNVPVRLKTCTHLLLTSSM